MATADPDLELQGAIVQKLKADPGVAALVNGRIFDSIPAGAAFPYVSYGPSDLVTDDADCLTAFNGFHQLDAWSRSPGYPEVKRVANAVRVALHDASLALPTNALVFLEHRSTRYVRDPDGLTSHAIIQLETVIEYP
jgi:hypothetical protein